MTAEKFVKLHNTKKWVNLHKNNKEIDQTEMNVRKNLEFA